MTHLEKLEVRINVAIQGVKEFEDKNTILIDSAASITIFHNKNLFYNSYKTDKPKLVTGVTKGKPLVVYTMGDTAFGVGYYCKDVDVNILSMGELEE